MNPFVYIGLLLLTTFFMGSAFPIGKIGLSYAPPFFLMGIRFLIAGFLLSLFVIKRSQPQSLKQWLQIIIIGLFQSTVVLGCAYYSMNWIRSGESAIIIFTSPLLVIILSSLFLGKSYRFAQWFGVVVGIIGVVVIFGLQLSFQVGTLIGIVGAISFAIATLLVKRWGASFDQMVLNAYQMIASSIFFFIISACVEQPHLEMNRTSLFVILYLALFSSIGQFSLWFYLLKNGDPAKTSAFLFLAPLFGVLSSWFLLHEPLTMYTGIGGLLICIGIFLINWQRNQSLSPSMEEKLAAH
ncbi:Threonine/homoserine efflux transporter RhtA [Seinonella peptonophila]|uniref:Threonine/homoserine efflux transporter RhtA n=1 Tax=Seinonella peptonophila TaxID=112248 RepID=A0A1M4VIH1_9BACL|nr:DMT family transporter [Seinonella peptonophila]SHE68623.1 Threonine/homoserine efflux transporter RhtA [Seinonella peptonophila]